MKTIDAKIVLTEWKCPNCNYKQQELNAGNVVECGECREQFEIIAFYGVNLRRIDIKGD
jgi:Zn finger protein HypA/HybF involved in hydrogenase expression